MTTRRGAGEGDGAHNPAPCPRQTETADPVKRPQSSSRSCEYGETRTSLAAETSRIHSPWEPRLSGDPPVRRFRFRPNRQVRCRKGVLQTGTNPAGYESPRRSPIHSPQARPTPAHPIRDRVAAGAVQARFGPDSSPIVRPKRRSVQQFPNTSNGSSVGGPTAATRSVRSRTAATTQADPGRAS